MTLAFPSFLVVGAQRSGTTFLWGLLRQHPDVFMPEQKELHYFDEVPFSKSPLEEYAQHFATTNGEKIIGEITPEYLFFDWIPELIFNALGQIRLIFLLRNPIERAYSHYWLMVRTRREILSFERAIQQEPDRLAKDFLSLRNFSYVQRGIYIEQIRHYLEFFDRDKMLFIISEKFYTNPCQTMHQICRFLEIDDQYPFYINHYRHHTKLPRYLTLYRYLSGIRLWFKGKRGYWPISKWARHWQDIMPERDMPYPPINVATRCQLQAFYTPFNRELADFLGQDLSHWQ